LGEASRDFTKFLRCSAVVKDEDVGGVGRGGVDFSLLFVDLLSLALLLALLLLLMLTLFLLLLALSLALLRLSRRAESALIPYSDDVLVRLLSRQFGQSLAPLRLLLRLRLLMWRLKLLLLLLLLL